VGGLAAAVALVGLVVYLIYRSRAGWALGRLPKPADGSRVVVAGEDDVDWPAEIVRAEAEGVSDAVRAATGCWWASWPQVIADLVGRTRASSCQVGRTAPGASPAFAAATEVFEAVWYGGEPAGSEVRDRFVAMADQALRLASPARAR
jgi:hypothetical protein